MKIVIFCDGGARGNPGDAAIGYIVQNTNLKSQNDNANCKIIEEGKYIGTATNNQAEYRAVIEALKYLESNQATPIPGMGPKGEKLEIEFLLDSQLIVEQLNGRYKVKNQGLKPLFDQVQSLISKIDGKINFRHIRREQNTDADRLVNEVLDKETNSV